MDNISMKKNWQDGGLLELRIEASSQYVSAYQNCYIEEIRLNEIALEVQDYAHDHKASCYLEFGNKDGNFTPAFSMKILPAELTGHVQIEADIEIADNDARSHRCCFFVNTELGMIEKFGKALPGLISGQIDTEVSLH